MVAPISQQSKSKPVTRYTVPPEAELIQRAGELVPFLRSRADEIDQLGSVPDDVIDRIRAAGLFKILQPVEWGGYGLTPITFMLVLMELARGGSSGSAAWVYMVLGGHQSMAAALPTVAEEIWGRINQFSCLLPLTPPESVKR